MFSSFSKLFNFFLVILILIYIIFEELVWEKTAKPIFNYTSKFILKIGIFEKLVSKIESLNRYLVLFIFLILFFLVELLGVFSVILFVEGEVFLSIFIYALKLPFAVIILWFFDITKERLLKFRCFEIIYNNLIHLKNRIKSLKIYNLIYQKIDSIKEYVIAKFSFSKSSIRYRILEIYQKLKAKF